MRHLLIFFADDLSGTVFRSRGLFLAALTVSHGDGCNQQGDGFVTANGEVRKQLGLFLVIEPRT